MELARYLLIRYLTEVLGFKLESERGDDLALLDGANRVSVKAYFADIYEEAEIYKKINELLQQDCDKAYIALAKDALPLVDPKHLKALGVGLISVDPSRGLEGVELRMPARARPRPAQQVDLSKILGAVNAAVAEAVSRESKRIEEEVFKKLKSYVDKALEDVRRELAAGKAEQRTEQRGPPSIAENEWVKLIRRRG
ncbi:MAG: hypothetical protein RXQ56_08465 [Thermoproteus sp.]|uniref:hypothetical protein n=1 Tax=Thermoproteus sp. CP80 TaxID=1650659 RepID=UPI0009BE7E15|nr:hypothetical protein [Thermoproteus sp. CP80]PLC64822.1 hypothetical protein B7L68_04385 [Thermoproteus sp. CP80]